VNKKIVFLSVILFIVACSTSHSLFQPEESDVARLNVTGAKITLADLTTGYHLYVLNCSGCHSLYRPSIKNKNGWEKILPEMFSKMPHITTDEQQLIRQYIFSKL
jgi:hypothetical protein